MSDVQHSDTPAALTAAAFLRQFRLLIVLTWTGPAVFGMGFLLYIRLFTPEQIFLIQTRPLEPLFVLAYVLGSYLYFSRLVRPIVAWLHDTASVVAEDVQRCIRGFSLRYWAMFLSYLLLAPSVVIVAARLYSDFHPTGIDWFRIHLVALISSIIVGLPIFFLIFDLFGKAVGDIGLRRPILSIRTKVFLIGALVPLMIDTMLVQYYWTRTGYFSFETFTIWLFLELLAVAGSLIFVRSFGQSLAPLQRLIGSASSRTIGGTSRPLPGSTDELGLLTADYQRLLAELQLHNEVLLLKNELLRRTGVEQEQADAFSATVELCRQAINSDISFLVMHDPISNDLVGLAQTPQGFSASGHFRLQLNEISLAVWVFNHKTSAVIEDANNDSRVSREMCERFGIRATIATPLWLDGKPQGVLIVVDRKPRTYTAHEVELVEGLAREVALVVNAHRLRAARQTAENEHRKQVERVQQLMDAVEEGVYGIDAAGLCTFINPAAVRMLGYTQAGDFLQRNIHDLIHHTLPDGQANPFPSSRVRVAMQAGKTAHAEDELFWRADGTCFPVEYWSRPLAQDGDLAGAVVSFFDISARKASERELTQHRQHLETLVRARTADLEAVNRELEAFSYSVSHDLRAPLRAIDGFSQALLEDNGEMLDAAGQDYLQRIRGAAQRMGALIDDLLQLSRVSRADLHDDQVDMSELAEGILRQLTLTDEQRLVKTTVTAGLTAIGDAQLLLIVLTNLLENAWKYTGMTAQPTIEFGMRREQGQNVYYVRDNGAGFDMRFAGKLFSPFQRLHGAEFPGTGIGLATVRRIIRRHGGKIWAEASVGQGACFYFTLRDDA